MAIVTAAALSTSMTNRLGTLGTLVNNPTNDSVASALIAGVEILIQNVIDSDFNIQRTDGDAEPRSTALRYWPLSEGRRDARDLLPGLREIWRDCRRARTNPSAAAWQVPRTKLSNLLQSWNSVSHTN